MVFVVGRRVGEERGTGWHFSSGVRLEMNWVGDGISGAEMGRR